MTHTAPTPATSTARINGWDRAAIVALGGAGCALSYDALVQMATAIHVRGLLTYLFPLVIDGFIAYGVRALLVLRTAPLAARCYVWLLFGTATAASIWANALHAVRLNQQHPDGDGLRLGDLTVGVLSTLAPLALAGAVHLYILIARRTVTEDTAPGYPGQPRTPTVRHKPHPNHRPEKAGQQDATPPAPRRPTERPDTRPTADTQQPTPRTATDETPATRPDTPAGDTAPPHQHRSPDDLLPVARRAVTDAGKVTRQVVADAIRGQGIPLSNDRLTLLMAQLRTEDKHLPDTYADRPPAPATR